MNILIVLGAALLLSGMLLIPAERQIQLSRKDHEESLSAGLHTQRDYSWINKWLERLLRLGFIFLVSYILFANPELLNTMLVALSLK